MIDIISALYTSIGLVLGGNYVLISVFMIFFMLGLIYALDFPRILTIPLFAMAVPMILFMDASIEISLIFFIGLAIGFAIYTFVK